MTHPADHRITLTHQGRTVHWDVSHQATAYLAQQLAAALGPADGEDD